MKKVLIIGFMIVVVLGLFLSGCGIKGPLTQKPAQEKTQNQKDNAKTKQIPTLPAKQP